MKIQSSKAKGLVASGLFALTAVVGGVVAAQTPSVYAAGQTCTWAGTVGSSDNKFSTASNWTNCSDGVPAEGDIIRFDHKDALDGDIALTNDLGVSLGGLRNAKYDEGGSMWGYKYVIDTLALVDGASVSLEQESGTSSRGTSVAVNNVSSEGSIRIGYATIEGMGDSAGQTTFNVQGSITAEGSFFPHASSSAASLVIAPVSIVFGRGGGSSGGSSVGVFSYDSLTVQRGVGVSLMADYAKPISFGGGSGSDPVISFWAGIGDDYQPVDTTISWTSPVTLLSNAKVYVGDKATVNFTGTISGASFSLARDDSSRGVFSSNPTSNDSQSETGIIKNKAKETKLEGDEPGTSEIVVDKETAILLGTRAWVSVLSGGILKGTGVARSVQINEGGVIAPGLSPGCITTSSLALYGIYQVELGGKAACSEYDQIIIDEDSTDLDPTRIISSATLDIYGFGSFVQSEGDQFVIIDNRTDKDVNGTFKDLPEGAEVKVGDAVFTISYKGGDGNDVVLTAMNSVKLPGVPNTGIAQIVSANPVLVAISGLLAVGALIFVRRKA